MQYNISDRTLALAGVFQATRMVQQVARNGMCEQTPFEACINSVFKIDAATPEDVYDGAMNMMPGLKTLLAQLGGSQFQKNYDRQRDIEVTKYAIGILVLERKLTKHPNMIQKISQGIDNAKQQLIHFAPTHENVIANLAGIYSDTISTLKPKIIVNGEHNHLSNSSNANKIRALLLAAIRSAVLWRQCGGTRWQLLLNRKAVLNSAQNLVKKLSH